MSPVKRLAAGVVLLIVSLYAAPLHAADEPVFAGLWSKKEPGGLGGLFYDQTWDQLVSNWKALGRRNQYLADVEAYRVAGRWRFASVWRMGPGNGALLLAPWDDFIKVWTDLGKTQELIDLEVLDTGAGRRYLGVWREKQEPGGTGALFVGLTWDELVARRAELRDAQYLADVETYGDDRQRLFAGVWRMGPGNGALYWKKDWSDFAELKRSLNDTQRMLDFEMFQSDSGGWNFLGVWRVSDRAGPLHASTSNTEFKPLTALQFVEQWKKLQGTGTLTGLAVAVPVTPPLTTLRADTTCTFGDADCNRCAMNVPDQFRLAFEGGHRPWIGWQAHSWTFRGNAGYPPDGMKPEDAFLPFGEGAQVGIVTKHVQGFVRTNSSRFPYAGSHSHRDRGSIFFVERDGGKHFLHSLHRASNDHPSGVSVLGDGLFVAEGNELRRFRVSGAGDKQHRYDIPRDDSQGAGLQNGGAGLGLARLEDGTTLLIVSAPGGGFRDGVLKAAKEENRRPRFTRLYRFVPNAFDDRAEIIFLGEWRHDGVSSKPKKPLAYSENLSVVTECGTGRIYTIHTTGDYALKGSGYWRLSRVELHAGTARLVHLQTARQDQHNEKCHHRSAATVHVNRNGELEFLCTERAVIKWHPTGEFDFREGTR